MEVFKRWNRNPTTSHISAATTLVPGVLVSCLGFCSGLVSLFAPWPPSRLFATQQWGQSLPRGWSDPNPLVRAPSWLLTSLRVGAEGLPVPSEAFPGLLLTRPRSRDFPHSGGSPILASLLLLTLGSPPPKACGCYSLCLRCSSPFSRSLPLFIPSDLSSNVTCSETFLANLTSDISGSLFPTLPVPVLHVSPPYSCHMLYLIFSIFILFMVLSPPLEIISQNSTWCIDDVQ